MARPRNIELHDRVTQSAFRQFHEKGYTKTTYASIAAEANCKATTVQDYYLKKELLARAFFDAIIDIVRKESRHWDDRSGRQAIEISSFAERFRDGVLYYEYLQSHCRQYAIDITANVALSNSILLEMARWAYTDAGRADVMDDPGCIERIVKSLGGFHALLNYQLSNGQPFDAQKQFTWLAYEWLDILGYTRAETLALIQPGFLSESERAAFAGLIAEHFE